MDLFIIIRNILPLILTCLVFSPSAMAKTTMENGASSTLKVIKKTSQPRKAPVRLTFWQRRAAHTVLKRAPAYLRKLLKPSPRRPGIKGRRGTRPRTPRRYGRSIVRLPSHASRLSGLAAEIAVEELMFYAGSQVIQHHWSKLQSMRGGPQATAAALNGQGQSLLPLIPLVQILPSPPNLPMLNWLEAHELAGGRTLHSHFGAAAPANSDSSQQPRWKFPTIILSDCKAAVFSGKAAADRCIRASLRSHRTEIRAWMRARKGPIKLTLSINQSEERQVHRTPVRTPAVTDDGHIVVVLRRGQDGKYLVEHAYPTVCL